MLMKGSSGPVVALRLRGWPVGPGDLGEEAADEQAVARESSIVSMRQLVDGALNDVTVWPVFTLSSWTWSGPGC